MTKTSLTLLALACTLTLSACSAGKPDAEAAGEAAHTSSSAGLPKGDIRAGQELATNGGQGIAPCTSCHGAEGKGQKNGEHWVFPALWGPDSFNWGAGMHQIGNAAGFIKANMPLGQAGMLSDQEAWDVAYFMNAYERPQDPRYTESVAKTRAKYAEALEKLAGLRID